MDNEPDRFLVNVIQAQHRRPASKLKGLRALVADGHEVRLAQFSMDALLIDGKRYGWEILENPEMVKTWHQYAEKVQA